MIKNKKAWFFDNEIEIKNSSRFFLILQEKGSWRVQTITSSQLIIIRWWSWSDAVLDFMTKSYEIECMSLSKCNSKTCMTRFSWNIVSETKGWLKCYTYSRRTRRVSPSFPRIPVLMTIIMMTVVKVGWGYYSRWSCSVVVGIVISPPSLGMIGIDIIIVSESLIMTTMTKGRRRVFGVNGLVMQWSLLVLHGISRCPPSVIIAVDPVTVVLFSFFGVLLNRRKNKRRSYMTWHDTHLEWIRMNALIMMPRRSFGRTWRCGRRKVMTTTVVIGVTRMPRQRSLHWWVSIIMRIQSLTFLTWLSDSMVICSSVTLFLSSPLMTNVLFLILVVSLITSLVHPHGHRSYGSLGTSNRSRPIKDGMKMREPLVSDSVVVLESESWFISLDCTVFSRIRFSMCLFSDIVFFDNLG